MEFGWCQRLWKWCEMCDSYVFTFVRNVCNVQGFPDGLRSSLWFLWQELLMGGGREGHQFTFSTRAQSCCFHHLIYVVWKRRPSWHFLFRVECKINRSKFQSLFLNIIQKCVHTTSQLYSCHFSPYKSSQSVSLRPTEQSCQRKHFTNCYLYYCSSIPTVLFVCRNGLTEKKDAVLYFFSHLVGWRT
jgi:hypothetical protein